MCAVLSVPLFYCLARRVLGEGTCATVLAVAIFAVSEPPIRYAAEVKPYSADLLVSLLLLYLAVAWLHSPGQVRLLWALAAAMPLAVSTSLPSIFVIGAIAVVGLVEVLVRFSYKLAASYIGFVGAAGLAMGCMAALGQYHAAAEDRNYLINFWIGAFPPSWRDPAALCGWLIRAPHRAAFCVSARCQPAGVVDRAHIRFLHLGNRPGETAQPQDCPLADIPISARC